MHWSFWTRIDSFKFHQSWKDPGLRCYLGRLVPHSTNQTGLLNLPVAGNEGEAYHSRLRNNETIIGIRKSRKGRSLEKQLHVVDAQIKIICLGKRNDEVAEWQRKSNPASFGKKHYFFKNSKRDKHCIGPTLYLFKRAARSPAKPSLPASDMVD
jgi:hypothetical protein